VDISDVKIGDTPYPEEAMGDLDEYKKLRQYMARHGYSTYSTTPQGDFFFIVKGSNEEVIVPKNEVFGQGGNSMGPAGGGGNNTEEGTAPHEDVVPSATAAVALLMQALRLDLNDENFRDTPTRVAKALASFCRGEGGIEEAMSSDFTFVSDTDTLVAEQGIPVAALCPHHLFPWFGTVDIGYIPNGKVLGLSKFPRLVHAVSHACPMMQETLTDLVAMHTQQRLNSRGIIQVPTHLYGL
jgi:GTP cyclohydrolase I